MYYKSSPVKRFQIIFFIEKKKKKKNMFWKVNHGTAA